MLSDIEYQDITRSWKYQSPKLNDCQVYCLYNVLMNLSKRVKEPKLYLPLDVVKKDICQYNYLRGPIFSDICERLNQKMIQFKYEAIERGKPDINLADLNSLMTEPNCSYPIISVR